VLVLIIDYVGYVYEPCYFDQNKIYFEVLMVGSS